MTKHRGFYGTHKTETVRKWLRAHPRFQLRFTPTSSSWLNLVERWFAELTNKKLRGGVHRSVEDLEADITDWIKDWNENPPAVRVAQDRRRDPRVPVTADASRTQDTSAVLGRIGRYQWLDPVPHRIVITNRTDKSDQPTNPGIRSARLATPTSAAGLRETSYQAFTHPLAPHVHVLTSNYAKIKVL